MQYLANKMSWDDDILQDSMLQDLLQDIIVVQTIHDKIYIYSLHNLTVQFSSCLI